MSSLILSERKNLCLIRKKQPFLFKLLSMYAVFNKLKKQNCMLEKEKEALLEENNCLVRDNKILERQILQLREIVTLQAQEKMQMQKRFQNMSANQRN